MSFSTKLHILLIALLFAAVPTVALAQDDATDKPDRDRIMSELKPYKHDFLTKDLKLDKEQAQKFLPIYDEMDEQLMKINDETRSLERNVMDNKDASDTEIEAAARAVFQQKQREAEVELAYYDKFKEILTPRQLLRLKGAERRFNQFLVRHHRKLVRERNDNQR